MRFVEACLTWMVHGLAGVLAVEAGLIVMRFVGAFLTWIVMGL